MRTKTASPVFTLVIRAIELSGRVRWAAVMRSGSKSSPLAAGRFWKPGPYQLAHPVSLYRTFASLGTAISGSGLAGTVGDVGFLTAGVGVGEGVEGGVTVGEGVGRGGGGGLF